MSNVKHGMWGTRTYTSWYNMKQRCTDKNNRAYKWYGARGITYDPRWENFENFYADMGRCPPDFTIERKDNNGNYNKENCVWLLKTEQNKNQRPKIGHKQRLFNSFNERLKGI